MSRVIKKTQMRIDDVRRFLASEEGARAREKLAAYVSDAVAEGRALIGDGKNPLTRRSHEDQLGEALADWLALHGGQSQLKDVIPTAVAAWMRENSGDVVNTPDPQLFSRNDASFHGREQGVKLFDALAKHVGTQETSLSEGDFYGALANLITKGNAKGEGSSLTHWWQERWPRAQADASLPLDDVLDVLQSPEKHPLRMGLLRWLRDEAGLGKEEDAARAATRPRSLFDVAHFDTEERPTTLFEDRAKAAAEALDVDRYEDAYGAVAAVVTALAEVADDDGRLTRASARKLGPHAGKLFDLLAHELEGGKRSLTASLPEVKYKGIPEALMVRIARSAPRQTFIDRMPALSEVSKLLGGAQVLEKWTLASVQHLFPSTLALYDELEHNGLSKERTEIVGKPYSTDEDVYARLVADGRHVDPRSRANDKAATHASMGKAVLAAAQDQLAKLFEGVDPRAEREPRFLLLDEGGKLVTALHERYPEYAHLCVAVEQTDRGIQEVEEHGIELKLPVMNVARSWLKKLYEGPLIGESVVHSIELELKKLHDDFVMEPKEATVIGYGAVGKNTADALRRRGYKVFVYDTDPKRTADAVADGCHVSKADDDESRRREVLARAQLLVSCTGKTTLTPDEYDLLPNQAVLVNAASGNHELGVDKLLGSESARSDSERFDPPTKTAATFFRGKHVLLGADEDLASMHHLVHTSEATGARRLVLRKGSVINMTEDIPPEYIQLTRSLLLAACLLAVKQTTTGLIDMPDDVQTKLRDFIQAHLQQTFGKKDGEPFADLMKPDFRQLADWRL